MPDTSEKAVETLPEGRRGFAAQAGDTAEVGAGLPTRGRAVGYAPTDHALVYADQPVLTARQATVYDRIAPIVIKKLLQAQDEGLDEFVLMNDWEWPDLLRGLSYRSANIVGNVKDGLLPVWAAIEALLQRHGYRVIKAAQPWRLIARR